MRERWAIRRKWIQEFGCFSVVKWDSALISWRSKETDMREKGHLYTQVFRNQAPECADAPLVENDLDLDWIRRGSTGWIGLGWHRVMRISIESLYTISNCSLTTSFPPSKSQQNSYFNILSKLTASCVLSEQQLVRKAVDIAKIQLLTTSIESFEPGHFWRYKVSIIQTNKQIFFML